MIITKRNFIKHIKNKNEKAMYYLIDNYGWLLKTVVYRNLASLPNLQEECINDCLMGIWENIDKYQPDKSSFENWIAAIAKYKCIDYKRKYLKELYQVDVDEVSLADDSSTEEAILKKEVSKEVDELLNTLSKEDKKIFIKFYFEDKTALEIAEEVDLKEATIHQRLSRGRKKIKERGMTYEG